MSVCARALSPEAFGLRAHFHGACAALWRRWRIEDRAVLPRLDGRHPRRQRPVSRREGKGFGGEIPCLRQQVERARRSQFLNELAAETPRAAAPSIS